MSLDLNSLLKDWPHEVGAIKVRKIIGLDGNEKLQLRIDLGILQMEMTGRPDGQRPHNCESLLVYHQRRAERAEARGESYELTPEQCNELQQEGILMMNTRAKASILLGEGRFGDAMREIEQG